MRIAEQLDSKKRQQQAANAAASAAAAAASAAPLSQTWDGEPCPVHHQHPAMPLAALYGMGVGAPHPAIAASMGPSSVPPSIISGATTVRRSEKLLI